MSPRAESVQRERDSDRQAIRRIYWWAFVARALAGLLAYIATEYLGMRILEDALYYEDVGYYVASQWLSGTSTSFGDLVGSPGSFAALLIATIAMVYYLLQGVRAVPILLVVYSAVTAFVPVYTYRLARELGTSASAARWAAWLVAISPAFAFWSGSLHKEGLTLLLLNVSAYHILRLQSRWRPSSLMIVVSCVLALWGVRYYLAILMAAVATGGLLLPRTPEIESGRGVVAIFPLVRQALIVSAFVGLVFAVGFAERVESVLVEDDKGFLVQLDANRHWLATAAQSGYLEDVRVSTPRDALAHFPLGLLYFLTVPLPWQLGSVRQNVAIPETALWLLLYPAVAVGIVRGWRVNRSGTIILLAVTGGMCVFYGLLSGNVGTAFRMRSQVWLLWAPFAAWGWEVWRERRHKTRRIPSRVSRSTHGARSGAV